MVIKGGEEGGVKVWMWVKGIRTMFSFDPVLSSVSLKPHLSCILCALPLPFQLLLLWGQLVKRRWLGKDLKCVGGK